MMRYDVLTIDALKTSVYYSETMQGKVESQVEVT